MRFLIIFISSLALGLFLGNIAKAAGCMGSPSSCERLLRHVPESSKRHLIMPVAYSSQRKKRAERTAYRRPAPTRQLVVNSDDKFKAEYSGGKGTFVFDPKRLQWFAYNQEGQLVKAGFASGGKNYCPDIKSRCLTPRGSFRVYRKGSASCKSRKFPIGKGGAPMPHCMFFHGGYAIHGSYHVPNYNASHGCIRVRPIAAAWLHKNFMNHGTRVIVKSY